MINITPSKEKPVICWWSGGITSAVAVKIAIQMWGKENCRLIFMDTFNEDDDTMRFKKDCEEWYGLPIESAHTDQYDSIQAVWLHFGGMNFATGAICSTELKRAVRLKFQKENPYSYQIFGFDTSEPHRARSMTVNYPRCNAVYPLLLMGLTKEDCMNIIEEAGIRIPQAYYLGLLNNNCLKTGCVRGGLGYWQHLAKIKPDVYEAMADMEHYLTWLKGEPVTLCKDQSKEAKLSGNVRVFLRKHRDYPHLKALSEMEGRPPKPLKDCNGYCAVDELGPVNDTVFELTDDEFDRAPVQLDMFNTIQ